MCPNAGLTMIEEMGLANKADRFTRTDGTHLGVGTSRCRPAWTNLSAWSSSPNYKNRRP